MSAAESMALACRLVLGEMGSKDRDAIDMAAPHALSLAGHGAQDVELLRATADFLSEIQRDYAKSLEVRRLLLRAQAAAGEAESVAAAATYAGIGHVHELLGQPNEAILAYEEVVRVLKQAGREPLRVAKTLDSIGVLFYRTQVVRVLSRKHKKYRAKTQAERENGFADDQH